MMLLRTRKHLSPGRGSSASGHPAILDIGRTNVMRSWPNQLFINGEWVNSASGKTWSVVNPATGQTLAEVALADAVDVDRAVTAARRAFDGGEWPQMDPLLRGRLLFRLAERLRESLHDLAMTDTL